MELYLICKCENNLVLNLARFHSGGGGGGGGGLLGGLHPVTYFAREGVFFKTSSCLRFVKEGYFFEPRYEGWGMKIPLRNIRGFDAE